MRSISLFALVVVFNMADAGVYVLPAEQAPADIPVEDGCWVKPVNRFVSGTYSPVDGTCKSYVCQSDGSVSVLTCGVWYGTCKEVPGNSSQPYPGCCSSLKCGAGESGYGT